MLLPSSPSKNNGSFFESEAIGPTIVPVKDQPSSYTSDDLSSQQEHRFVLFLIHVSKLSLLSRRIYLRDLPAHVADMSNDSGYKFSEEYEVCEIYIVCHSNIGLCTCVTTICHYVACIRGWTGPSKRGLLDGREQSKESLH